MAGVEIGAVSVAAILILIWAGMYVPVALMLVSFVGVWAIKGNVQIAVQLLTLAASDSIENYVFGVIPLFVLMGLLVSAADLGVEMFQVANQLFRRLKGGLGVATVAANAVFAAITGISIASAAVFTRVAVPEMLRFGYSPRFAVGVVAGSSVLGMLIPPSLLLIVYALITEQSVGDMFVAAVIPGLILAAVYCLGIVLMARFWPDFVGGPGSARATAQAIDPPLLGARDMAARVAPTTILVGLVIGGIYGGVFTPTEAGAVGALGALILALAKRRLSAQLFWSVLTETGHITASICVLVIAASMYSRMLGLSGVAGTLGHAVAGAGFGLYGLIAIFVVVVLVLGTMIDSTSILLITVPLFLPMLAPFEVNLVWFGVLSVIAVEVGLLTPPMGIAVFVVKSTLDRDDITLYDIFAGSFPFVLMMLAVLGLIIAFPALSLVLL